MGDLNSNVNLKSQDRLSTLSPIDVTRRETEEEQPYRQMIKQKSRMHHYQSSVEISKSARQEAAALTSEHSISSSR